LSNQLERVNALLVGRKIVCFVLICAKQILSMSGALVFQKILAQKFHIFSLFFFPNSIGKELPSFYSNFHNHILENELHNMQVQA
jgi:hypothetical protein